MRVKLAAQTLSASVAKALQYVHNLNIDGFDDCLGTAKFVSIFDRLFDIFNSKSPFAKGYKGPLTPANFEFNKKFLQDTKQILLTSTQSNGQKVCEGKRKIGFVGFAFNIESLLSLAHCMFTEIEPPFKYILTYKFSQDHLEIFFSNIRHSGGWNNNPSSLQFRSAYRSLLCRAGVQICDTDYRASNCVPMDSTSILSVAQGTTSSGNAVTFSEALFDHDDYPANMPSSLSDFCVGILGYIGGFLIRSLSKKSSCKECVQGLLSEVGQNSLDRKSLIELKNNGGLKVPSDDVIKVLKHAETVIRSTVNIKQVKRNEWSKYMINHILRDMPQNLFTNLNDHFVTSLVGIESHYTALLKLLVTEFIRLRHFHVLNVTNQKIAAGSKRQKLNKTVLFQNT